MRNTKKISNSYGLVSGSYSLADYNNNGVTNDFTKLFEISSGKIKAKSSAITAETRGKSYNGYLCYKLIDYTGREVELYQKITVKIPNN